MSQQDLLEFLFFSFAIWTMIFCFLILFIFVKFRPEDDFFVKPIFMGFQKIFYVYCSIVILAHIFL